MQAVRAERASGLVGARQPETAWDDGADLVRAAKARSPLAWTHIYDANYRKLFRYALARTNDIAASEDIASNVFFQALKDIDSFKYRGKPLIAWLYGIARHMVSRHLRSEGRERGRLKDIASRVAWWQVRSHAARQRSVDAAVDPRPSADPADFVERLDLRQALDRLTDDQREVTVLHFYVGLSIPEISRLLGKKERAVYSLHARALDALRRHLEDGRN